MSDYLVSLTQTAKWEPAIQLTGQLPMTIRGHEYFSFALVERLEALVDELSAIREILTNQCERR